MVTRGSAVAERGRARGRVGTWPQGEAHRPRAAAWPGRAAEFTPWAATYLRQWLIADTASGRLLPWLPVAFGFGIAAYFTAGSEPAWWAAIVFVCVALVGAFLARRRPVAFPLVIALAAIAAGFATATLRAAYMAHPILQRSAFNVSLSGFVEVREERERSDRIVIRVLKIEGARIEETLDRVRLSVKRGLAPPVGAYVSLKARLNPPLAPLRPGGYDFARDLYFQGIGAVGFVTGVIRTEQPPAPAGLRLRAASAIEGIRDAIDQRIRRAIAGDAGAIASALITGKRDAISVPVNDAMYVSSLAHVLSISGYHMAVVAGVVFFVVRALLALWPMVATRHAIKKWAAIAALVAATSYLILSGAEVATRRAFIMTAIILVGVLVDRPALTLRNLALAALAVLLIAPEAVVHPSFQMSFAATLALVATWERGLPWMTAQADTSLGARLALWGVREILALILASLVAGFATMPYAAYHFHRLAPYGVIANLLAMPVVSAWVMPSGLLALVALPFGFDAPLWRLMGVGIDWMTGVALWVTALPGAVGRTPAFGTGPLLLGTAGLIVICLLRTHLRWAGALLIGIAIILAMRTPSPDILVASTGDMVAVRTETGRLAIMKTGGDPFTAREWLAADGDARLPNNKSLADGFTCDVNGCLARLADGTLVAFARTAAAVAEDCARASLVVTRREVQPGCAATVVDRKTLREHGATALRRSGQGWEVETAWPSGYGRPWARAARSAGETAASAPARFTPRDATPRLDDLEAGDAAIDAQ